MKNKQAEMVKRMSDKELLYHLYMSQLLFFLVAAVLAFFLFEGWDDFLILLEWDIQEIFTIGSSVGVAVVVIDLILMKYVPRELMDDGGINEKMFQKRSTLHIIALALLIATVEELLFRGVIQTHFGIWIASFIFAIMHIRYLHKWLLLISVILLSFLLGYLYEWTENLLVTIWAHFIIDVLLALKIRSEYVKKTNGEVSEGYENRDE
ncbi:membrane protease YdiL (CAAX protease family) [Bacillus tianshenii]|uniref:Membrane protease YdiL (CAAX protease family) n=1 Tax=Sutcliffiella tianshenii TaxID=1463404 RepID=A0ABS2P376_9BACI|nr:type II CAAX endopeptidase family protein [Bacillus tianshenii]MBM7621324.1 membrane protease YdiL (CAAX protease family) [Bacillus tianshenii]